MENKFKLLSVKIQPDDLNKLKLVLRNLKNDHKDLIISAPKMGKLGKDLLISFKINEVLQTKVVKSLSDNKFTILSLQDRNRIIQEIKNEKESVPITGEQEKDIPTIGWSDLVKEVSDQPHTPINHLINEGNYLEIIKIARDVRINDKTRKEALNGVGAALNILISRHFRKGSLAEDPTEQINFLLKIGGDQNLKLLREDDLMKHACNKAIELATNKEDYYNILFSICNNHFLPPTSTIDATVKLSDIIFSDAEKYFYLVEQAVSNLNLRWLEIAFDSRPKNLPIENTRSFKKLINLIYERRNSKGFRDLTDY